MFEIVDAGFLARRVNADPQLVGPRLLWVVHVLASGWYICASLHDEPLDTWVMRRMVGGDDPTPLADQNSFDRWLHSMYFVLTAPPPAARCIASQSEM